MACRPKTRCRLVIVKLLFIAERHDLHCWDLLTRIFSLLLTLHDLQRLELHLHGESRILTGQFCESSWSAYHLFRDDLIVDLNSFFWVLCRALVFHLQVWVGHSTYMDVLRWCRASSRSLHTIFLLVSAAFYLIDSIDGLCRWIRDVVSQCRLPYRHAFFVNQAQQFSPPLVRDRLIARSGWLHYFRWNRKSLKL